MDGSLIFDTKIDNSGFEQDAQSLKGLAQQAMKGIGALVTGGAMAKALISTGKKSVELASDLQEVQNVVDVTFGNGAEQVNTWSKSAVNAYGLSELAAKQYAGTMGAMLKSMGLTDEQVLDMSMDLTGLAADFASFYNMNHEEAFAKIRSGLSGETEPLKQLGINMSVANLEAYALSQGIDKSFNSMTQAEQALLRYNYLLSVSADAQGDFARTSDSFANASRIVETNIERVESGIGNRLLPTVTKVTAALGSMAGELADSIDSGGLAGGLNYIETEAPLAAAAVKGLAAAYISLGVIKGITKMTAEYQTALVAVNVATAGGATLTAADMAVMTAKEAVVSVLTGKTTLLAAAQAKLNAAMAANPFGVVAIALVAVASGIALADRATAKYNPKIRAAEEDAIALKNSVDELTDSMKESAETYEKTKDGIESNTMAADGLIDKLTALSASYSGTRTEQKLMQQICDKLNSSVDGMNISFDDQTGKLNLTADAMKEYAAQAAKTAQVEAAIKRLTDLYTEQAEAEYQVKKTQQEMADMSFNPDKYSMKATSSIKTAYRRAPKALEDVNNRIADQLGYLDTLGAEYNSTTDEIHNSTAALEENAEASERVVIAGHDVTDALKKIGMSAEEAQKMFDNYAVSTANLFEVIDTSCAANVAQMIKNLEANNAVMEQYGDDLVAIADHIPDDLYAALSGDPAQFAGIVRALASAPDDLDELTASWEKLGEADKQAYLKALGATPTESENPVSVMAESMDSDTSMEEAGESAVRKTKTAMTVSVADGTFYECGVNAIQGFIDGMNSLAGAAEAAAGSIGAAAAQALKDALAEKSPSKLTRGYGRFFTIGFANGVLDEIDTARKASGSVAVASLKSLSSYHPTILPDVRELPSAPAAASSPGLPNVTQIIYSKAQSPAELLRETIWQAQRAVMVGV